MRGTHDRFCLLSQHSLLNTTFVCTPLAENDLSRISYEKRTPDREAVKPEPFSITSHGHVSLARFNDSLVRRPKTSEQHSLTFRWWFVFDSKEKYTFLPRTAIEMRPKSLITAHFSLFPPYTHTHTHTNTTPRTFKERCKRTPANQPPQSRSFLLLEREKENTSIFLFSSTASLSSPAHLCQPVAHLFPQITTNTTRCTQDAPPTRRRMPLRARLVKNTTQTQCDWALTRRSLADEKLCPLIFGRKQTRTKIKIIFRQVLWHLGTPPWLSFSSFSAELNRPSLNCCHANRGPSLSTWNIAFLNLVENYFGGNGAVIAMQRSERDFEAWFLRRSKLRASAISLQTIPMNVNDWLGGRMNLELHYEWDWNANAYVFEWERGKESMFSSLARVGCSEKL